MSRSYLFIDIADQRAALVRLPDADAPADADMEIEGRIYEHVAHLHDFVSAVLDMSHGDADGLLTACEMQGRDWSLEPIENEWFVTLRRVPEVNGQLPRNADFEGPDRDLLDRIHAAIATKQVERPR